MKAEQLRKSILQLAIQGKLVPQDPADEPASVLLERIRAEKQRLIKEGKIKKDKGDSVIFKGDDNCYYEKTGKNEPVSIDEEASIFDLPDNWILCRLSAIADIFTGNSINEAEKQKKYMGLDSGYNYIGTKDVGFDHSINYTNGVKIPYNQGNFRIAHINTPLLCIEGGSAGRKIGVLTEDVCFGNKLCAFEPIGINPKYLYYYLQNPIFTQIFKEKTTGIIGGVSVNSLKNLLFAMPPLAEQERIVAEIEKFEPLIAEYDKLEQQATKLDGEIYDKLKKSILQYAIQGKLVPQDSNDEPAAVLLERIRAGKKAQLGKKYVESYIYKSDDNCYYEHINGKDVDITEEIPYDLPIGWIWERLRNITEIIGDGIHGTPNFDDNGKYYFINGNNLVGGKIVLKDSTKKVNENEFLLHRKPLTLNTILLSINGTLGNIAYYNNEPIILGKSACYISLSKDISKEYVRVVLETKSFLDYAVHRATKTTIANISLNAIRTFLFPVPPLAEQKRIVEKIDEIFAKL